MSTWIAVWLVVALVTTVAVVVCVAVMVRHVLIVGRSARQLQETVQPLTDAISAEGQRASARSSSLELPTRPRRDRR